MGKILNEIQRREILLWAQNFDPDEVIIDNYKTVSSLTKPFLNDLNNYFSLCQIARSTKRRTLVSEKAEVILFKIRTQIEKWITTSLIKNNISLADNFSALYVNKLFGGSKKQGLSFRIALTTCVPTALCANRCYAHDALDASPNSVMRCCLNDYFVKEWIGGNLEARNILDIELERAIKSARMEAALSDFKRSPRIRFSHVGEITKYPEFSNYCGEYVYNKSNNEVRCVVCTRHPNANLLEKKYWVINFTIDESSIDRMSWINSGTRLVSSSFNGKVSDLVDVNFLEHHNRNHFTQNGDKGNICPATLPTALDRSCDGNECDYCFESP